METVRQVSLIGVVVYGWLMNFMDMVIIVATACCSANMLSVCVQDKSNPVFAHEHYDKDVPSSLHLCAQNISSEIHTAAQTIFISLGINLSHVLCSQVMQPQCGF